MTILVPVDYSKASKTAVHYAAGLAKQLGADIKMLHVVQANTSGKALLKLSKLQEQLVEIARHDGELFFNEVRKSLRGKRPELGIHIKHGTDFTRTVNQFCEGEGADLIVMGTTGASGLKKILLGSNAAAMINTATVPVLAVPPKALYTKPTKIVYATNLKHTEEEIKTVAAFAEILAARVEVFYVAGIKATSIPDEKDYAKMLRQIAKYQKIGFTIAKSDNIPQAVENFVKKQNARLLTTFTHKLGFFEKLFERGMTRKMVYHIRVPILAFNKSTLK
ncbi:MAG: hypothetical protein KatS3mg032_1833 [Cyclobacteriaceae bacterium]|nr:MAG: hypothetical protein KatS3mg032_1833 [Cyclobacteriaceae bacterium]